ncbi:MAG: class I SAM-dependent methyltransferase [Novosphingobium sp.]|nr:class I SAM-dependent methyltransferase [Novosphingobium sp.]
MDEAMLRTAELVGQSGATGRGAATVEPIEWKDSKIAFAAERCSGKRVLDLGCVMHDPESYASRYFLHRAISEVAREAVGLDLYEAGVNQLRARGYDVHVGDAENFAFDEPFDVIVAGDIVEHLSNLEGFLKSCDANLAEGGVVVVQTPNPWYWRNVVKSVLYREVPNNLEHTCWFCPRTWRQLIERYGFELGAVQFDARYWRDRLMPLPQGLKYPAWSAEIRRKN